MVAKGLAPEVRPDTASATEFDVPLAAPDALPSANPGDATLNLLLPA
jgi:hypothetical protein